jgi:hypothetical protein
MQIYDIYSECYHQRPSDDRTAAGQFLALINKRINKRSPQLVPPCTDADKATRYLNVSRFLTVKNSLRNLAVKIQRPCNDSFMRLVATFIEIFNY